MLQQLEVQMAEWERIPVKEKRREQEGARGLSDHGADLSKSTSPRESSRAKTAFCVAEMGLGSPP